MSSLHVDIKEALGGCSCYEQIVYTLTYVLDLKVIAKFPVWAPVTLMSYSDILDFPVWAPVPLMSYSDKLNMNGGSLISD